MRNYEKWLLSCIQDYEEAAANTNYSNEWQADMARRAGHYYGRLYALKFGVKGAQKPINMFKARKGLGPVSASARVLALLVRDPKYAGRYQVRITL